ncbi:MAG: HEAT repeat domain-containing protein [Cyanobacteria bacterium P01_E01_bin.42]
MTETTLLERLKHPNPNLRDRAMREIAETRDENTIPQLMKLLAEEDMVYRRAAVKTLGAIGFDAVPSLADSLYNNDNATIRASCTKALAQVAVNYAGESFPELGLQALTTALGDLNPVVHIAAAMALGAVGSQALDILIDAVKTTDNVAVAMAIVNAIGSIPEEKAKITLMELAEDESVDDFIRETAGSALSRWDLVKNSARG